MRDKNRIPRICKKLENVWMTHPDMRLGQLMVCILGTDPFYMEDNVTEEKIKEFGMPKETDFRVYDKQITKKFVKWHGEDFEVQDLILAMEDLLYTEPGENTNTSIRCTDLSCNYDTMFLLAEFEYAIHFLSSDMKEYFCVKDTMSKQELQTLYDQLRKLKEI